MQVVCSPKCALDYARKEKLKEVRKEKREWKKANKPLATVCSEAQKDVNLFVRVRDHGKGCISCDSPTIDDAGHFFPIGSKFRCNRLRFDTRAIHGQCRKCNSYTGGGNLHGYIAGLERRYGRAYVELLYDIKRMAEQGDLAPLTKDEVARIAADHRRKARELGRALNRAALA